MLGVVCWTQAEGAKQRKPMSKLTKLIYKAFSKNPDDIVIEKLGYTDYTYNIKFPDSGGEWLRFSHTRQNPKCGAYISFTGYVPNLNIVYGYWAWRICRLLTRLEDERFGIDITSEVKSETAEQRLIRKLKGYLDK